MAHIFIGVGQCGCQILDAIFSDKIMFRLADALAVDSTPRSFMHLKNIPVNFRAGISRYGEIVRTGAEEFGRDVSDGFGADPDRVENLVDNNLQGFSDSLIETITPNKKNPPSIAFLIFAFGGGTGGGCSPYFAGAIKEQLNIPIVGVGVLPAKKEGTRRALAAATCLNNLHQIVDGFILIDNERIAHYPTMENYYKEYNKYVAAGIVELAVGMQIRKIDPKKYGFLAK